MEQNNTLTKKRYEPYRGTPLFDAIGKTVKKLKSHIKEGWVFSLNENDASPGSTTRW